jgi:hypothetical protein
MACEGGPPLSPRNGIRPFDLPIAMQVDTDPAVLVLGFELPQPVFSAPNYSVSRTNCEPWSGWVDLNFPRIYKNSYFRRGSAAMWLGGRPFASKFLHVRGER